jgi:4-amino-4-deoxy-L-arabinose transferase-like glycosyltransferase
VYGILIKPIPSRFIKNIFISIGIILISLLISGYFYDLSSDGQSYHQGGIILLKESWNPVFEDHAQAGIWIKHYPKGIETLQAILYILTGRIEVGKAINLLLIVCSFLLAYVCLVRLNLKKYKAYIYAFLIAANPVNLYQMFTFYIDGVFYSALVCMICSFILIMLDKKSIYYLILSGSIVIALSVKFTSIPVVGILLVFMLIFLLIKKRFPEFKNTLIICSLTGFICFPITNFNPYITNLMEGKHVFYPLMGDNSLDIITPFVPEYFNDLNRFEKFTISLFSKSGQIGDGKDILKVPFTVHKKELNRLADSDIGVGGFGVFYSGIIILTLILMVFFFIRDKLSSVQKSVSFFIFILLISVFIIPEPFWFRYIPHFYLIPILLLLIVELSGGGSFIKNIYKKSLSVILFFYFLNLTLILMAVLIVNIYNTEKIDYQFVQIKSRDKIIKVECFNFSSNLIRLKEHNISYEKFTFKEGDKYFYLSPPYKEGVGTKIEYFEFDPKKEKGFLYFWFDKVFAIVK